MRRTQRLKRKSKPSLRWRPARTCLRAAGGRADGYAEWGNRAAGPAGSQPLCSPGASAGLCAPAVPEQAPDPKGPQGSGTPAPWRPVHREGNEGIGPRPFGGNKSGRSAPQAEAQIKFPVAAPGNRHTLIPLLREGNPASVLRGTEVLRAGTWRGHKETSGRAGPSASPLGAVYMGAAAVGQLTALCIVIHWFPVDRLVGSKNGRPKSTGRLQKPDRWKGTADQLYKKAALITRWEAGPERPPNGDPHLPQSAHHVPNSPSLPVACPFRHLASTACLPPSPRHLAATV